MKVNSLAFALLVSACSVYGWGQLGHETIGYVAMQFLAPKALSFVKTSLGSTFSESLGPAAPWADTVRHQRGYTWTAPFHFIDAKDDPPTSCSVDQTRDCAKGTCILSAIANYTERVVDESLSSTQRQEALKFLDHFIGDIGQPLHVENFKLGGNQIKAKCGGTSTNLHATWDTGMIKKLLKEQYGDSVTTWSDALVTRIQSGEYQSLAPSWISCSSTTNPVTRSFEEDISGMRLSRNTTTSLECPLVWAQDSNTFDCTIIFDFTPGQDLCNSNYYTNAVPVIETQIAKQGYRLAAWLNVLFDGTTNLP